MYLLDSLSEDIVHIMGEESLLEALFACWVDTLADNSGLIYGNAVHRGAGYACADYLSRLALHARKSFYHSRNMLWSSSAAAAEYGNACVCQLYCACGEIIGIDVIFIGDRIGKSCVGLCDNGESGKCANPVKNREELLGTERTVYADSVRAETFQNSHHTFGRNARKGSHIFLKGHSDEHGLVGVLLCGENSGFYLVKVGHGLDDDNIGVPACEDKLLINVVGFFKFQSACRFEKLTYRSHIESYKSASCGSLFSVGNACGDYLLNGMTAFCQLEAVCAEGVGVDDISAAFDVQAVYLYYSLGIGDVQQFGYVLGLDAVSL